jgi:hypothetical protein
MNSLPATIEALASSQPEGSVLTARALLHLGNRAAVDQALSRLVRQGRLLRVGRGTYTALVQGKYGQRPPEPARVVDALARETGEVVVPHAAVSANRLGLSLQVPMRPIYMTSGRSRLLRVGKLEVELRHASGRNLRLGTGFVPEAIRALEWLGPKNGRVQLPRVLARMQPDERQQMFSARSAMPTWLAAEVSKAIPHG